MLGRIYLSLGVSVKYFYDRQRSGFNQGRNFAFLLKKLSVITRNPKNFALSSGLAFFFKCDKELSFETKNAIRPFIVAGNMQMNGTKNDIEEFLTKLGRVNIYPEIEIILAPPTVYLEFCKSKAPANISLAAQNCYKVPKGDFTGEISPAMLKDIGVGWVILGHSERQQVLCETDPVIKDILCHSLSQGMSVIACVGDTLEDRENGKSEEVIFTQMKSICMNVIDWTKVVIAYEPLWASAEGKSITPDEVQKMHSEIRGWLKNHISLPTSQITRIIYACPVLDSNVAVDFAKKPDVDGFFVNDPTLDQDEFIELIYEATDF